jgi:hypothetical protein
MTQPLPVPARALGEHVVSSAAPASLLRPGGGHRAGAGGDRPLRRPCAGGRRRTPVRDPVGRGEVRGASAAGPEDRRRRPLANPQGAIMATLEGTIRRDGRGAANLRVVGREVTRRSAGAGTAAARERFPQSAPWGRRSPTSKVTSGWSSTSRRTAPGTARRRRRWACGRHVPRSVRPSLPRTNRSLVLAHTATPSLRQGQRPLLRQLHDVHHREARTVLTRFPIGARPARPARQVASVSLMGSPWR